MIVNSKSGGGYEKIYVNVASPGHLKYWKDDKVQSTPPLAQYELKMVVNLLMVPSKKAGGDSVEVMMELSGGSFSLRLPKAETARAWYEGLEAWKDFALESDFHDKSFLSDLSLDYEAGGGAMGDGQNKSSFSSEPLSEKSRILNKFQSRKDRNTHKEEGRTSIDILGDNEPPALEGWLEKKSGSGKFF